jgi:hypothetical protein
VHTSLFHLLLSLVSFNANPNPSHGGNVEGQRIWRAQGLWGPGAGVHGFHVGVWGDAGGRLHRCQHSDYPFAGIQCIATVWSYSISLCFSNFHVSFIVLVIVSHLEQVSYQSVMVLQFCLAGKIMHMEEKGIMGILHDCSCTSAPALTFKIVMMKHTDETISFV